MAKERKEPDTATREEIERQIQRKLEEEEGRRAKTATVRLDAIADPQTITSRITSGSWVPLGAVVSIVGACVMGTLWFHSQFTSVTYRLEKIEDRIEASTTDRFRRHDMANWCELLKAKNPSLDVPEIAHGH
jgi:hypothetical protein